ncbi:unnamed protein product [Bursaphelenchus xylophilus]|uniref:(pine wood nematode) hypothetical protein n=1 Tax=Bursaphelenchus xylophilus TaxID=6326 RepID=A0A1I7RJQ3_BURXY|nr:srd-10 [Bursaphelenchus xylophilus]CAD5233677.1 unnamed protein product [Bursaphelenchus xylophilus]CAG9128985.1 unnamed protein product [Bursaphelenchus xylophilus]
MLDIKLGASPNNPYAWDFPDEDGRFPSEPFDELGSISFVLHCNYIAATLIGGVLSFSLLYLVIFHTHGALRSYRKILLLCSFTDISYWAVDNIIQTKLKEKDGVFMVAMEGPIKHCSYQSRLIFLSIYIGLISMVNSVLPAQVYFRYYALTRTQPLTTAKTIGLFSVSVGVSVVCSILSFFGYGGSAGVRPDYNYGELWYREVPLPPVFYADVRSQIQKVYFFYGGALVALSYLIAIVIGYKTMKTIRRSYVSFSGKTRRLQAQLTQYLIVQSVIPLLVSVVPMMLLVVPQYFYIDTGRACLFYSVAFSWIPIINPLITMAVIIPYRRLILSKLCCAKRSYQVDSTGHFFSRSN